jgi:Kinesin motor domain
MASALNNSALRETPASPSELSFGAFAGNGLGSSSFADTSGVGGYDDYYDDGANYLGSSGVGAISERGVGGERESRADSNFKVVIRVRPPLPRELHGDRPFQNVVRVDSSERALILSENLSALEESAANPDGSSASVIGPYSTHCFTFDHVYDQHCDQKKVYETTAKSVVESSLSGYNATIFAYGQVSLPSSRHEHQ